MLIKNTQNKKTKKLQLIFNFWKNRKVLLLFVLCVLVFIAGVNAEKNGTIDMLINKYILRSWKICRHWFSSLNAVPEHLTIDIKHIDFQKLAFKREQALKRYYLFVDTQDYVPATITYQGAKYSTRIRLKGDHIDHLKGDKWSFRVRIGQDETLAGMKQFSLQHPNTRNYVYEWLYHQLLKGEGIINLRYDFVTVTLNGKNLGVYALEEHFEKRLVEHNRRREGPIIRFDEDLFWWELEKRNRFVQPGMAQGEPHHDAVMIDGSGSYLSSNIDAFQTNKILQDDDRLRDYKQAITLLEGFRRQELNTRDVFDVKQMAIYFAIADLCGAEHATRWHNMRFYYNPITSRLEPIGFDADVYFVDSLIATRVRLKKNTESLYYKQLFADEEFFREYIQALTRIARKKYLGDFFKQVNSQLQEKLNILYKEFPEYSFSPRLFFRNQAFIKATLSPQKLMHAYFSEPLQDKNSVFLSLGNIQSLPVEVLGLAQEKKPVAKLNRKSILEAKQPQSPVAYRTIKFELKQPQAFKAEQTANVQVACRILATEEIRLVPVFPWPYRSKDLSKVDTLRQQPNISEFKKLKIDDTLKEIVVQTGVWELKTDLIVPPGYYLKINSDTQIRLSNDASIISYSPIHMSATEEEPVTIEAASESKHSGIFILRAHDVSRFEHVVFKNLSAPEDTYWKLTGAITFYESEALIKKCTIQNIQAEDAVNSIRSKIGIEDTLFENVLSDAVDIDFGRAQIFRSSFVDCGNDAIDLSASHAVLKSNFITKAQDKAISVGENSEAFIDLCEISEGKLGIASKDRSSTFIDKTRIKDCQVGIAVYQKKPEFGPAKMDVRLLFLENNETDYLLEKGSQLKAWGEPLLVNIDDAKENDLLQ